jgi:hypothetical protein
VDHRGLRLGAEYKDDFAGRRDRQVLPSDGENTDGLGHLVRSVADAWVDPDAGRWGDHRKASDRDCQWAWVHGCR